MVWTEASLRETEGVGFEGRGVNEEVLEVSSSMSTLVIVSSISFLEKDSSSTGNGESSDFSTFLNQLLEKVADNI